MTTLGGVFIQRSGPHVGLFSRSWFRCRLVSLFSFCWVTTYFSFKWPPAKLGPPLLTIPPCSLGRRGLRPVLWFFLNPAPKPRFFQKKRPPFFGNPFHPNPSPLIREKCSDRYLIAVLKWGFLSQGQSYSRGFLLSLFSCCVLYLRSVIFRRSISFLLLCCCFLRDAFLSEKDDCLACIPASSSACLPPPRLCLDRGNAPPFFSRVHNIWGMVQIRFRYYFMFAAEF